MKYFANFYVNNGTSFRGPITGTNKRELRNKVRDIAEAYRFAGNEASFKVWHENENGDPICDYKGYILNNGQLLYDKEAAGHRCY